MLKFCIKAFFKKAALLGEGLLATQPTLIILSFLQITDEKCFPVVLKIIYLNTSEYENFLLHLLGHLHFLVSCLLKLFSYYF